MSDDKRPPLPPGVSADDTRLYRQTIAGCWIVAGLLIELPLETLDKLSASAETLGPALHPDLWRANAQPIMEDREMIRALATAQRDILTTAPALAVLAGEISAGVDRYRPRLDAFFRDVFTRRDVAEIPPAMILAALVRFIARAVPPK